MGLEDSVIVGKNAQHLGKLTEWLKPVAQSGHHWQLCWRASQDGWAVSQFHSLCDGKGPTVTIIRVDNKYIFGGYTALSWMQGKCLNSYFEKLYPLKNKHDTPKFRHDARNFWAPHSKFSTCQHSVPKNNTAPVSRLPPGGSLGTGKRGTVPKKLFL